MNEFTGKKLGEVLAFSQVSSDTITMGRDALIQALGVEKVIDIEEKNRMHGDEIMRIATDGGVIDITLKKAEDTASKLIQMRDLYVAGKWDNATELMEWSGFFEGASIVHWALVRGIAEGLNNESLLILAEEAVNWHYELIEVAEGELASTGQSKSI